MADLQDDVPPGSPNRPPIPSDLDMSPCVSRKDQVFKKEVSWEIFGSCVQWIFVRRPQVRSSIRILLSRIARSCSRASQHPGSWPTYGLWWVAECQDGSDLGHRYEMLHHRELQRSMRVVHDCRTVDVLISRADRVDGVFGLFYHQWVRGLNAFGH
jgi:hypothetical protein